MMERHERATLRRTRAVHGMVDFPVDDKTWDHTAEGGTIVRLVVIDDRGGSPWEMVCGTEIRYARSEVLVGDDTMAAPKLPPMSESETSEESIRLAREAQEASARWVARHFPHHEREDGSPLSLLSRNYRAVLLLGVTGWTGSEMESREPWVCTKEHLTEAGRTLYDAIAAAYQGCTLALLTFIDT